MYGTVRERKSSIEFRVNYRLRHLRQAARRGELPKLRELAYSSRRELYGDDALTYYAMSRYVLLYLDQQDKLTSVYRSMRKSGDDRDKHRELITKEVDYKRFVRWSKRLKLRRKRKRRLG